ncbi:MAG: hypothetical protein A3A94_03205 [Candidatus Portnoybacteria bacterium RIFCSPLOWO2_01_FULL_43_11]|uniref:CYTH domain-containing protein n=3 Tax=Candidatus Portnoyibacteriota TaxID=1817913 RepID=A0A1G2FQD1_9BACT|nr:MAG: hypothetical protein A3A94_03205 [Candidatus Portnoybacteria bacterium RIFCSPLOWO2_01_FULL_43_11]OGZ39290.1 MAG: hypothetical protein A3E90_02865 [Candidatus Portnoybacteria bacterium RIFCSPHIGHO2_12_FULL_40_11]OGZ39992.1 MAG: hypothetical protein A3I20_02175 [Candidatus Portnoybacteria bacterium RIFCSPLOWO2_02_FULL_40_15]
MFEIEFRAKFDLKKFNILKKYLNKHAENLGEDNKDCYYYIFTDKLLKLVNNTSKKTAKISLKLNRIGEGAVFPEIEFYFSPNEFDSARRLFEALELPVKIMHDSQERVNYRYKNCEIALKYSDAWGYHIEIEQIIDDKKKQAEAETHIRRIADELGIRLMSEEELKKFIRVAENKI